MIDAQLEFGPDLLSSSSRSTYEEKCRLHVEQCWVASSSYNEDIELHQRVTEWQAKMDPLLKAEEQKAPYDIDAYAKRLLAALDDSHSSAQGVRVPSSYVPFAQAAQASSQAEVCRMFLAALQLTNTENVDLQVCFRAHALQ